MSQATRKKTLVSDTRLALQQGAAGKARLLARRLTRLEDLLLKDCALSSQQFQLLAEVAAARDDRIGALAKSLDLDPSTLSRNLQGLERLGLVEIAVVEGDLRRRAVWLTETGARRLEAALKLWQKGERKIARALRSQDLGKLLAASEKLKA